MKRTTKAQRNTRTYTLTDKGRAALRNLDAEESPSVTESSSNPKPVDIAELEKEFSEIGERMNDIESHWPETYHAHPEWKPLKARLREIEPIIHPAGDDGDNLTSECLICQHPLLKNGKCWYCDECAKPGNCEEDDDYYSELETLRAERDALRAALEPFAKQADYFEKHQRGDKSLYWFTNTHKPYVTNPIHALTVDMFRKAKEALAR